MKKIIVSSLALVSIANATLIYPIPVEIKGNSNRAFLTIKDENTKYQATIYRWVQKNGKDELIPTKDDEVIVYPPLFKGEKELKIVFLKNEDRKTEKSYRIFLEELKTHKNMENQKVNELKIRKVFSIPVFVLPIKEKVSFKISCKNEKLTIKNTGNRHLKILSINNKQVYQYILPDNVKSFNISKKEGFLKLEDFPMKIEYQCK